MAIEGLVFAFWGGRKQKREARDFFRFAKSGNRVVVCCANAALTGFDRCTPELSSAMLDAAMARIEQRGASVQVDEQVNSALDGCRSVVELWPSSINEEPPVGWATVVVIDGQNLTVAWVGGDQVVVLRGETIRFRSSTHLHSAGFLDRGFGSTYKGTFPEVTSEPTLLDNCDRVFVLSDSVARCPGTEKVLLNCASEPLQDTVERLVRQVAEGSKDPFAFAIARDITA